MPKAVKAKTKAATKKPYEESPTPKPCELPTPKSLEEFEALVKKYEPRRKRGRPKTEECEKVCDWCTYRDSTPETQTNILREQVTVQHWHSRLCDPTLLCVEVHMRLANPDLRIVSNDQLWARLDLQEAFDNTSPIGFPARLGHENLDGQVTLDEMQYLLKLLNRLFFPGAPMEFTFTWGPDRIGSPLGSCSSIVSTNSEGNPVAHICLHPTSFRDVPEHPPFSSRAMGRMSTLLHEVVHAYLRVYTCTMCTGRDIVVDDISGHGVAWQHVAGAVERAAFPFLGVPLSLGRFRVIKLLWWDMKYWPLWEDVRMWELHDDD
jgi:hypothetical protein